MKNKAINTLFISGITLSLASCGGLGGESIYDLDKPGEALEIQKEIIEKVGDLVTYEVNMTSQGELETSLDWVTVASENDETTVLETTCQLIGSGETSSEIEDNEFFAENYMKGGSKKLSEIDFDLVQKNFEAGKKLIPAEYVDHSLYSYTIEFDEGKRADTFIINTLLKDESDHIEGGDIVTNYYEFLFTMEEDGSLSVE